MQQHNQNENITLISHFQPLLSSKMSQFQVLAKSALFKFNITWDQTCYCYSELFCLMNQNN